jgi:hypothetical protein
MENGIKWEYFLLVMGRARATCFKRVFGSVVVVAFQIAFRAEIHVNDVFLFFKNHF